MGHKISGSDFRVALSGSWNGRSLGDIVWVVCEDVNDTMCLMYVGVL